MLFLTRTFALVLQLLPAPGYDALGAHIAPLNDVDGDHCADFALDDGTGSVWSISGKSGHVIGRVGLGTSAVHGEIAPLFGDVDGDGSWDIVEWRARAELLVRSGKDLHVVRKIEPPSNKTTFVAGPAPAGDWDADGTPDVAVICSSEHGPSLAIFSGKDGRLLHTIDPGDAWRHKCLHGGDYLSERGLQLVSSCRAGDARAASFILVGGAGNLVLIPRGIDGTPVWLPDCNAQAWCNSGTGFVGDVDGDSFPDFVVSTFAPRSSSVPLTGKRGVEETHSSDYALRVVIVSGRTGIDLELLPGFGGGLGGLEGLCAARIADLDGDGIDELLVGEADSFGQVLILSGKDRRVEWKLAEDAACCAGSCRFGAQVGALGDVDGDGVADFAITSASGVDHLDPGCVAIFSGKTRQRLRSIWRADLMAMQASEKRSDGKK